MSNFFPVTVLVAIFLFISKETLEAVKNCKEKKRKIQAMKLLIAEELELNHWVCKEIRALLERVQDEQKSPENSIFQIKKSKAGNERFECIGPKGCLWGMGFYPVREDRYHTLAVEIAKADGHFYRLLSKCYESISLLRHIRDGVYSYIDIDGDERDFREGFFSYAENELSNVYESMNDLYEFCTKRKLETHRIR